MGAPETVLLRSRKPISEKSAYNIVTYAIRTFILLLVVLAEFSPLTAQDNFSHRRISLPENATDDVLNQFRMMQQLQQLMQQRDNLKDRSVKDSGDNGQPLKDSLLPPGLDPSMLQQLLQSLDPKQREAIDRMAKQLSSPEGLPTPMLDQLKSDTEKIPDPNLRKKAQELLDAYRDMSSEDRSKLTNPFVPKNQQQDRSGSSTQQPQNRRPQPNFDDLTKSNPPLPSPTERSRPQNEKDEPLPNPFDYVNKDPSSDEKSTLKSNPAKENDASTMKPTDPSLRRPFNGNEGMPSRGSRGSPWEERGNRQPFPDTVPSDRSTNSNKSNDKRLESPSNEDNLPDVDDLLRQTKEHPESLPPLRLPPNVSDGVKQMFEQWMANRNSKSNDGKFMEQLKGSIPPSLREEFRKSGVEQSMREVFQEARRDGPQSPTNPEQPPALNQPSFANKPDATNNNSASSNEKSKSWIEQITGQQQVSSQLNAPGQTNTNPQNTTSQATNGAQKGKTLAESVTSIYKSMTSPEKPNAAGAAPSPSSSPSSAQAESPSNMAWLAVAILAVTGLALSAWMLFRMPLAASDTQRRGLILTAESMEIRDRSDVVRVFHLLATRSGIPTELWWPHPRAAVVMMAEAPWAQSAIDALTRLYEIARYTPDHQQLSESELNEARQAVKQFHATEKRSIW